MASGSGLGAAGELHRSAGLDNELFQCLYTSIVEDESRGQLTAEFVSIEHQQLFGDNARTRLS